MAGYTDISNSQYRAENTALMNRINGAGNNYSDKIAALSNLTIGILGTILSGNYKSNKDEADSTDSKEKENLQNELNEKLKVLNIDDPSKINETVSAAYDEHDKKIAEAQTKVNNLQAESNSISQEIGIQKTILNGLNDTTDPSGELRKSVETKISNLQQQLNVKNTELKNAQNTLQGTITTEDAKLDKIRTNANEALVALNLLSKMSTKEEKFDASETKETLLKFNDSRNNFYSAKTDEDKKKYATELKELYDNNPNDATIKRAYEAMLKTKVEAALKQA